MKIYGEYSPTEIDCKGLSLPGRQDWLVAPVSRTRDSDSLEESNFHVALDRLGENDNVEVHRFGHWACGWLEIILIRPNTPEERIGFELESRLDDYPILDEDDLSWRELV